MEKHFRKYDDVCDKISELIFKLETLKESLYSVSGINYDKLPSTPNPSGDSLIYKIQEIDEVNEELYKLTLEKNELYATHEVEIDRLENAKERKVLRCFYLHKLSMDNIAELMGITTNHAYRLRREATVNFLKMLENDRK